MPSFCALSSVLLAVLFLFSKPAQCEAIHVSFEQDGQVILVDRVVPADMSAVEAAARAAITGPTAMERLAGVASAIPIDTQLVSFHAEGDRVSLDLSPEVLSGLNEDSLTAIFLQVKRSLDPFPEILSIRLTCQGRLLSSYLSPVYPVVPALPDRDKQVTTGKLTVPVPTQTQGLSGKNITIGPSHGRFWNGSGWYWQRSLVCDAGEALLEDTNSIRLCQFLYQYLSQDGATVHVPRQLNESDCCHGETGMPWWKMCASSWLHIAGLPCSVWASYSGNCGADSATSRSSDDIRARPLFADYRGSDIYIAHHTNAGGGGTANGTETFRDTQMEHPAHVTNSYNLAVNVQSSVISAIREMYDSGWSDRGVKDSAAGFGEIRIPNRPAILIELAFHDNCSRDGLYLQDNFFRSLCEWAIYRGVCQYFGSSPTWDRYSDEYVSDTIPTTMIPGQNYAVSITLRNRGVVWNTTRGFNLGAAGDSDPFTATTRHAVSGEVRPGQTYTFNFTLTAPLVSGPYTTDWQMLREGVAWFGATVSRQVLVIGVPAIIRQPVDQTVYLTDTATFTVDAAGSGTLTYQWQKNRANLAEDGHYIGVNTNTLRVTNVLLDDMAAYRCVVTNEEGSTISDEAMLINGGPRPVPGDFDADWDVDLDDLAVIQRCLTRPGIVSTDPTCYQADLENHDGDVDQLDMAVFRKCLSGADVPGDSHCAD